MVSLSTYVPSSSPFSTFGLLLDVSHVIVPSTQIASLLSSAGFSVLLLADFIVIVSSASGSAPSSSSKFFCIFTSDISSSTCILLVPSDVISPLLVAVLSVMIPSLIVKLNVLSTTVYPSGDTFSSSVYFPSGRFVIFLLSVPDVHLMRFPSSMISLSFV